MPVSPRHPTQYDVKPGLERALHLFLNELDTHIYHLQTTILQQKPVDTALLEDLNESEIKNIEHRLHTIKGGAGFLQLRDIQQCAANGEKIVESGKKKSKTEILKTQLQGVIDTLNSQAQELRAVFGYSEEDEQAPQV